MGKVLFFSSLSTIFLIIQAVPHDRISMSNSNILINSGEIKEWNKSYENSRPWTEKLHRNERKTDESPQGPYNSNSNSRYVELALVVDNQQYIFLGRNLTKIHHRCRDLAKIINSLYEPLNIFVALVGVEVWAENDPIDITSNRQSTLLNFLHYRKDNLTRKIPNDYAHLLTHVGFDNGVVGMALKGTICTNDFSGGITHEQLDVKLTASLIAHMMGHNLGMEHDSRNCSCPEERCTMSSEFGISAPRHWSSCSKDSLAFAFNHGMDHCLRNKPLMIFGGPVCGNGFVESGEECDCGVKEHCDNACCNPDNCTLTINATCATGECCDLSSCKWKNRGTPCRTADNECDLAEYCTGNSEYCPDDEHKINGDVCKVGEAFCYQGRCRSRTDQCKVLWGEGSFSEDFCYNLNKKASRRGNCRYDSMNSSYYPCDDEDILCGRLQCHSDGNSLLFGLESAAVISHSFLMKNTEMVKCRAAIIDLGLNDPDPGLVPHGAQCGAGKMCLNQKCVAV